MRVLYKKCHQNVTKKSPIFIQYKKYSFIIKEHMVNYYCKQCDYNTSKKSDFSKHTKTKKHKLNTPTYVLNNDVSNSSLNKVIDECNIAQQNSTELNGIDKNPIKIKILSCENCGLTFKRSHNMNRHFKTCIKRKDSHREKDLENKLKEKDRMLREKNNQLKKMEKYYGDIINNIGSMGPKNINSITYILGNYDKAPHLEAIKTNNLSKLPLKTNRDIENIICSHKNNLLVDQIIEAIVFIYKKKDPSEQSIWVTDTSRHNYIIKELLHDDDSKWVIDKKGVKSEKYLVKPILEHIRKIVFEYLQTSPKLLDNPKITSTDRNIILDCQHNGNELIKEIDDNTIGPEIIKKLSKHIHHNKNDAPMIEEVE